MSQSAPQYAVIRDESVITGQGAKLDIHPASPLKRAAAYLVDAALLLLPTLIVLLLIFRNLYLLSNTTARTFQQSVFIALLVIIPVLVETLTQGRSPGKYLFNIQVVRDDGGTIAFHHALIRAIASFIEIYMTLGAMAMISSLVSPQGKRLGDYAAGTRVISVPEPARHTPLIMPPDVVPWARTAQISRLPEDLQRRALSFIHGTAKLTPSIRQQQSQQLAQQISGYVSPPPPPNVHPERFIAAVLVVLRNREYLRMLRRHSGQ